MTDSTVTPTPGALVPGVGAIAEYNLIQALQQAFRVTELVPGSIEATRRRVRDVEIAIDRDPMLSRASQVDYSQWLDHVQSAGACLHPIRLTGTVHEIEASTGRVVSSRSTADMPDGVLYAPCKNRRKTVCPACAEVYRADTFQLIRAGLIGGKGVPDSVTEHPAVFATLAAPSFGAVHTAKKTPGPCHPRRDPYVCPHGVEHACYAVHGTEDAISGQPFCLDCYDYDHQAVWNSFCGELWRRTTIALNRQIKQFAKLHDVKLRLSFAKVAEFQTRGVVHFHAIIRVDGVDRLDPEVITAPDCTVTVDRLAHWVSTAASDTRFTTPVHPLRPEGWMMEWGSKSIDIRPIHLTVRDIDSAGEISHSAVAGYLAKYATKSTEDTGHCSAKITGETIGRYAELDTHTGRLINACWDIGGNPHDVDTDDRDAWADTYGRLRRWAHQLGYGGHFSTKSRRYSTTLKQLRAARQHWHRDQSERPEFTALRVVDTDSDIIRINDLTYAGIGWHTTADATLANTAAAKARERRQIAKEEMEDSYMAN